jgi:hypothetical protein
MPCAACCECMLSHASGSGSSLVYQLMQQSSPHLSKAAIVWQACSCMVRLPVAAPFPPSLLTTLNLSAAPPSMLPVLNMLSACTARAPTHRHYYRARCLGTLLGAAATAPCKALLLGTRTPWLCPQQACVLMLTLNCRQHAQLLQQDMHCCCHPPSCPAHGAATPPQCECRELPAASRTTAGAAAAETCAGWHWCSATHSIWQASSCYTTSPQDDTMATRCAVERLPDAPAQHGCCVTCFSSPIRSDSASRPRSFSRSKDSTSMLDSCRQHSRWQMLEARLISCWGGCILLLMCNCA